MLSRLTSLAAVGLGAYVLYPWLCRRTASLEEARAGLPGDERIAHPAAGYTLGVDIDARPADVWPWLVQLGQGRGGFYTHELVEALVGADVHSPDRIVPQLQHIAVGDILRLTPDPYRGRPRQALVVSRVDPGHALVLDQVLPGGGIGTWAFVLRERADGMTRLLFRRRSEHPSLFDRVAVPGYLFMDRGMLAGIRRRAESMRRHALPAAQ